jgi:flagellar assembly factor FliW
MPSIESKYFGPVGYPEDSVLEFPAGLPGFENAHQFIAIDQPENKPLVFLQSVSEPGLCFVTLPVGSVRKDFRLSMATEDLRLLDLSDDRQPEIGPEVLCLVILSFVEGRQPTANLLAPVVVNLGNRLAVQAIQVESGYSHQHPFEEIAC